MTGLVSFCLQVSPEVTRQVKEMEREALMEREVSREAQVEDQEESEGARPVQME